MSGSTLRVLALALAIPALAACGSGGTRWTKGGASKDAIGADLADCRDQAAALMARDSDIENDIMATRERDWALSGALSVKQTNMAAADRGREQRYVEDCMRAKGYSPAS